MKIRLSVLFVIALIVGLAACKKKYDDAPSAVSQVRLNVVNASADTVNIYLNGSRLNTTSAILPSYSTGYYYVPEGKQTYEVKKPFNVNTSAVHSLFSITLPADTDFYHTLFITDGKADDAFQTIDSFPEDTTSNTCYIRFVNSSPGSGNLDMSYGGTTLFSAVAFKSYSKLSLISTTNGASVTGLIPIKIFNTGSSTPLYIDSVSLTSGSRYTLYTLGTPGTTGFSLGFRRD
ncbi:DUF4397 domain-containing protein [Mucilaginibacter sp. BT774]|uniref:DUF4397 domain-containing protein n=1 Tax=Mucilaginibacter sp. BT774 TaxID=3062276 RepID=UPI0026766101|nr:DUF4397 domain-containing protein [Mucilaginibacter sp. BT774]MDO3625877.1 DUF4397 domain-containing protein [Mucilaginibacter sp. BT774]